jgi:superfamily II DNA or RNA helicase
VALAPSLAGHVGAEIRASGEACFASGFATIVHAALNQVRALVRGTSLCQAEVVHDPYDREIEVNCTCPFYRKRHEICEHIWATILAADAQELFAEAPLGAGFDPLADLDVDDLDPGPGAGAHVGGVPDIFPPAIRRLLERQIASSSAPASHAPPTSPASRRNADWRGRLDVVRERVQSEVAGAAPPIEMTGARIDYILDASGSGGQGSQLRIQVVRRTRNRSGRWGVPRRARLSEIGAGSLPDRADQVIVSLLEGAREPDFNRYGPYYGRSSCSDPDVFFLPPAAQPTLIEMICRTGRCALRVSPEERDPGFITWDEGDPWELWLQVAESPLEYVVSGSLRRGEERLALDDLLILGASGILVTRTAAARFAHGGGFAWAALLRKESEVRVPRAAGDELLKRLLQIPRLPKLDLPPSLRCEEVPGTPRPHLSLTRLRAGFVADELAGQLSFAYEGAIVGAAEQGSGVLLPERRYLRRDAEAEARATKRLRDLGFRDAPGFSDDTAARFMIAARRLPEVVRALVDEGWHVEASGQLYRSSGAFSIGLSSGVDWFDLQVEATFGDQVARLPELLEALRRGEETVRLGDGSFGILPQEWLKRLGIFADLGAPGSAGGGAGDAGEGRLRFRPSQVGLIDALLAAQPEVTCDESFAAAREELRRFEGIKPLEEPKGFRGTLRPYQREGLGWLQFLQQFRFGGCLADDMGLGKTVQVLALLESRRARRREPGPRFNHSPSLVVVPRSLIFNWKLEAERFAPDLRVLNHTGIGRGRSEDGFDGWDVVLTTYGTLRRDIAHLSKTAFDYVILDEAQSIKNASTQSAKAARLLRADHRLALSGTPIENHLGELWSLFEFLNPGMLGRGRILGGVDARDPGEESRRILAQALRPFILRRTKEQVASDLPQKLEQTLYCELLPRDRKRYDELRDHFRASLLQRIDRDGLNRSKLHVLEALLRLRQASCHCGLIDKSKTADPSAKLELLLPQLEEVIAEGHKALVFSQFTSMLAIVRNRLDAQGVTYEYLDGRTRDRQAKVDRFQNDPACGLFLISLKAGGLGLNLTAAEYVFLLDPWWNPAVEAQAVDRAHRIGQARPVFAFRLIARDTVEEKVLQLQDSKRTLAREIISSDDALVRTLTRDDLERLLS